MMAKKSLTIDDVGPPKSVTDIIKEEIRRQQETDQQMRLRRSEELLDQMESEGILVWQVAAGQRYEIEVSWHAIRDNGGDHGAFLDWLKKRAEAAVQARLLSSCKILVKNGQAWLVQLNGALTEKPDEIVVLDEEGHVLNTIPKEKFKV